VPVYWPGGVRHVGGVSLICGFCVERGKAHSCGVLADRLVVAVKLLLDAVGVERRGRVIRGCCSSDQPGVFLGGVAWTG
jgi:hypothetical protein